MIEYSAQLEMVDDDLFETTLKDQKVVLDTGHKPKQAQSPVEVLLSAIGSCSSVDVVEIIKKKRKTVTDFKVKIDAQRRSEPHPRILTAIHLTFILTSPDATEKELQQAAELSVDKYCTVAAMLKEVANITYTCELKTA